jgi:hypothetical protein
MEETGRAIDEGMRDAILRAVALCQPAWKSSPAATRLPGETWTTWLEKTHLPLVRPTFRLSLAAAARNDFSALAAQAVDLDEALAVDVTVLSVTAGRALLDSLRPTPGDRLWQRIQRTTAADFPRQFPVLFAVRAALFHLPPRVAEGALILHESRDHGCLPDAVWAMVADALDRRPDEPTFLAA